MSSHSLSVSPFSVDCFTPTDSMFLSSASSIPGCSNSAGDEDEDSGGHIVCAWCQKIGSKMFSLRTTNGFKVFCSELCFAQCRRASFKKNKVCDWCKHVRHTVNYVDFQSGEQSLQFCSDKCLNQYKMNIFCRETQAHLNAFSAVYRSPSPSTTCLSNKNYRSSNDVSVSDKDDSKVTEVPPLVTPDLWHRNSNFHQTSTSSSTSSQSPSSLSSSPHRSSSPPLTSTSESLYCLPSSSSTSLPQQTTFQCPSIEKCSQAICDIKPPLSIDQFRIKESSRNQEILTNKPSLVSKLVDSCENNHKHKLRLHLKTVSSNKQRSSKSHRNLNNNQENILDLNKHSIENTKESIKVNSDNCGSTPSNHSSPFSTRFVLNRSINQSIDDKHLEPAVNCVPTFTNLPNQCLPNSPMKIPHFPHPPHHQFLPPLRADFPQLRQSLPMFPFNQHNLFRLPGGHHRPQFHLPFPCHLPDHHPSYPSQTPASLQFQPSPVQPLPNNSFNYQGQLAFPVPHPFLLPLPMPIPLPIPFPIKFHSSSSLRSMISTEDKEVQVGLTCYTDKLLPQFSCNARQTNDVGLPKAIIVSENDNQTRFRIDTLMNKLIDKKMRAMSESTDQELLDTRSDCNSNDLKRTKIEKSTESGPNSDDDSKIISYHDDPSCFRKAKRFKRDILSI